MSMLVRERMPLRLHCRVQTPTGRSWRWGGDERRGSNVPQGLTFSTAMPGGFDSCSLSLERNPRVDHPDLVELSTLQVLGVGGQVAWEGRIEDLPSTYDPQSAGLQPQAVGWQAHLDDDDSASMVYLDRNLTAWSSPSTSRQLAIVAGSAGTDFFSSQALADQSGNPCLAFTGTGPLPSTTQDCEAWYDSGDGDLLRYVRFSAVEAMNLALGTGVEVLIAAGSDDHTLPGQFSLTGLGGAIIDLATLGGPTRYAVAAAYYSAGAGGTSGTTYGWQLQNLAVVGNHGLTIYPGPSGVSPGADDGLLASDIVAHAVGTWCPMLAFTTGPNGTIQPSGYVIPQAVFNTPTTASAIVKLAAQYEILDWAVWEGPTFYLNERGEYAGAKHWRARVGPSALQATGAQSSRIWNGVVVTYTGVDGNSYMVGPEQDSSLLDTDPQNPANTLTDRFGRTLRRWAPLSLNTTSTQAGAVKAGQEFLAVQKELDTSGQATLTGHVQDSSGIWWPAWMVRAGDYISFIDAADTSERRIVSTAYTNDSRANAIQLDQPPDAMSAILERMSASLSALAL